MNVAGWGSAINQTYWICRTIHMPARGMIFSAKKILLCVDPSDILIVN